MTETLRSFAVAAFHAALAVPLVAGTAMHLASHLAAQQFAPTAEAEANAEANADESPARPSAAVLVASGRTFTGFIDARTNDETLWLRFEHGRSTLWRPIAWRRVVEVTVAGETMPGNTFKDVAARHASNEDASRLAPSRETTAPSAPPLDGPPPLPRPPRAVRSLALDARLANWDADAEDDGLVAYVTPLDDAGRPTSATGTMTVDLIGMTGPRRPTWSPTSRGKDDQRPILETWTVQLTPTDFDGPDGSASVRLPFTRGEPADNPHLRSFGVVRARLAVPGADLVEAVLDPVRLRPLGKIGAVGR